MTSFIHNTLLKPDMVERREYQTRIAMTATEHDTMVILPTAMGKTVVALLTMLPKLVEGKVLVLAPTRPLVDQHAKFLTSVMTCHCMVTKLDGTILPHLRTQRFINNRIIVSTPQTIRNDLEKGRISLENVFLIVYDECHRAVGNYAYCDIAKYYSAFGPDDKRSLGLTASPGHTKKKLSDVMENLHLIKAEVRTEESPDVAPYIQDVPVIINYVHLPEDMRLARDSLQAMYHEALNELGLCQATSKTEILAIQKKAAMHKQYRAMSVTARALKLSHAIMLAETQGAVPLLDYVVRMHDDTTKAAGCILADDRWKLVQRLCESGTGRNPKIEELRDIFGEIGPKTNGLVFCTYRSTIDYVTETLRQMNINAARFIGQSKGMTQKEQKKVVQEFKDGKYDVLVCTSIGEEGIDISQVDVVVFYEPVSSAIRSIQRKGRTGRTRAGKCIILVAKDTVDEAMLRVADRKMDSMKRALAGKTR